MPPVALTGLGAVSTFGLGAESLRAGLRGGRSGIAPVRHFDTTPYPSSVAATVPGFDEPARRKDAAFEFALHAGREALSQASPVGRVGLVLGTSIGVTDGDHHELALRLAEALGLTGPVIAITTACCSSNNALGLGAELLAGGEADAVLTGGTDQITEEMFAGFSRLGALSTTACAPFSLPMGTTLGEGAGFVVLETAEAVRARGATTLAWLEGEALSCDGLHEVSPDPSGRGVARAVEGALRQAQVTPAQVDYVNVHGTGTAHNDAAEWKGLTTALGREVLVSSTKGTIGHAQGAAGVLEVIATLLCLQDGAVPVTHHFTTPRNRCPSDPVAQLIPRQVRVQRWLATNSAFWGANAALLFKTGERPAALPAPSARARLLMAGAGVVAGAADEVLSLPRVDLGALDLGSRVVTLAVAQALGSLGPVVKGALREDLGLFVAALAPSRDARRDFDASVSERGVARLSAPAFTRMVTSAIGGACARVLGLRGPFTTLTSGEGGGLVAVGCAARYLELHEEVRGVVAVSIDEPSPGRARAVAVLLVREGALPVSGPSVKVALAGRGALAHAVARVTVGTAAHVEATDALHPVGQGLAQLAGLRTARRPQLVTQARGNTTCAVLVTPTPEQP